MLFYLFHVVGGLELLFTVGKFFVYLSIDPY